MSITRDQIADLRPGDLVELSGHPDLHGSTLLGPLRVVLGGALYLGPFVIRYANGAANYSYAKRMHLRVIARAPQPAGRTA